MACVGSTSLLGRMIYPSFTRASAALRVTDRKTVRSLPAKSMSSKYCTMTIDSGSIESSTLEIRCWTRPGAWCQPNGTLTMGYRAEPGATRIEVNSGVVGECELTNNNSSNLIYMPMLAQKTDAKLQQGPQAWEGPPFPRRWASARVQGRPPRSSSRQGPVHCASPQPPSSPPCLAPCTRSVGPVDSGFWGGARFFGYILGGRGRMVVSRRWTSVPLPRLPRPLGMELRKRGVWEEDLLSAEGVLVPGWMEGERGWVSTSGARGRPIR